MTTQERPSPDDPRVQEAKQLLHLAHVAWSKQDLAGAILHAETGLRALGPLAEVTDAAAWQPVGIRLVSELRRVMEDVANKFKARALQTASELVNALPEPAPPLPATTVPSDPLVAWSPQEQAGLEFQQWRFRRGDFDVDLPPEYRAVKSVTTAGPPE